MAGTTTYRGNSMVAPGGASEKRSFDLFRLPRLIHNPAPWRKLPPSELPCKPNCRFSPSHAKLPILHRTLPTGLATLTVRSHLTSQSQQRVSSNSLIVASRSENCLPATHPTAPPLVLQRHMIFTCAAKHLCGAPPGMPVPPHCNHPEKPQHSCAICAESMHSAAFCGYELDEVKTQLASYSIQDSSAVLVCKLCYVSHSRDTAQGSNRNDNVDAAAAGDNGSGEDEYADMPLLGRRDLTAVAADSAAVACDKSPHDLFIDDSYV